MPDGLLIVDKPEGPTSHDVVARLRRLLREKRIGHTGTLDPMATGVLPLVIGRATRLAQFLTSERKRYTAGVRLGQATSTGDRLGDPIGPPVAAAGLTREAVEAALARFRGTFLQTPPAFSAKKVSGIAAYLLARRGRAAALAPVNVTVHALDLLSIDDDLLTLDVSCSAGFYVRSLAGDLGQALGCGAHLVSLRRTASGSFTLDRAASLAELEAAPEGVASRLLPLSALLTEWPAVRLNAEGERRVRRGAPFGQAHCAVWHAYTPHDPAHGAGKLVVRVLGADGDLIALARWGWMRGDGRQQWEPTWEGLPVLHPSVVLV